MMRLKERNGRLLAAIEARVGINGWGATSAFAKATGMHISEVSSLVTMLHLPIGNAGAFTSSAQRLMQELGCCPSDLWTDDELCAFLPPELALRSLAGLEAAEHHDRQSLPDPFDCVSAADDAANVRALLGCLRYREEKVLLLRFGFDIDRGELSQEEIAQMFNVTRERIRQIEVKALRKLKSRLTDPVPRKPGDKSLPSLQWIESLGKIEPPTAHLTAAKRPVAQSDLPVASWWACVPIKPADQAVARREMEEFKREAGHWPLRLYRGPARRQWVEFPEFGEAIALNVASEFACRAWVDGSELRATTVNHARAADDLPVLQFSETEALEA